MGGVSNSAEPSVGNDQVAWVQGSIQVRAIKGKATFSTEGRTNALQQGMQFAAPVVLQTAADSHIDLYLRVNGRLLRLLPNSELSLMNLQYAGSAADAVVVTRLILRVGGLHGVVRKLSSASVYEVETTNNRISIRGTDYLAYASGDLVIFKGLAVIQARERSGVIRVETAEFFEAATGNVKALSRKEWDYFEGAAGYEMFAIHPLTDSTLLHRDSPEPRVN